MMEDEKMMQGLVSIAIPAYKRKWLKDAIASVLNQDYSDIELIIVDDHSPQNLKEVVEPYLVDKRVSYYYNDINIGKESVANNWNKCLEYVRGEFFVLLCDDDVLMPNFVSELLCLAQKYPQCNIFHGRRMFYYEETGSFEMTESWPEYESFEEFVQAKAEGLRKHTITEFLYRSRSIVKEKYTVFPVGYFSDDASILKIVKEGGIASSQEPVCKIRMSDEQISHVGRHAVEKVRATLMYYEWYIASVVPQKSLLDFKNAIDDWAYSFYRETTLINKIHILSIIPNFVWPLKQKFVLFFNALFEKR